MLAANPPTSRLLSTYSKSLSGDRRVHRLPPSRYKAISCHIPATSRLTTTYSYKNKLEDQPLPEVSGHPEGYNFEALCRIWEGTAAYGAEVTLPSPVRGYDPEVALGESALHIVRPTPLYLSIYSPVVRRTGGRTLGRTVKTASTASYH